MKDQVSIADTVLRSMERLVVNNMISVASACNYSVYTFTGTLSITFLISDLALRRQYAVKERRELTYEEYVSVYWCNFV